MECTPSFKRLDIEEWQAIMTQYYFGVTTIHCEFLPVYQELTQNL